MTWYNVNKVVQVWSGHADSAQKKGKLYPPAGLEDIDEYKGSVQFDPEALRFDFPGWFDEIVNPAYPQFWVRKEDLSNEPYDADVDPDAPVGPDEEPPVVAPPPADKPSHAEIGRVVEYLLSLL